MVYSKADWECESTYDPITDPNGIDLVALSNSKGDAMVRFLLHPFILLDLLINVMNLVIQMYELYSLIILWL